jgi:galactokinase
MGGGFGGCTINIVKQEGVQNFLSETLAAYKKQFSIDPEYYQVKVVNGTCEITNMG